MPIHDRGYHRYRGLRRSHGRVWWIIARAGIGAQLRRRRFLALLLLAWLPFLVRTVQLYFAANLPQAAFLGPSPQMLRDFLTTQSLFAFFVTILAGAGLIADDRRVNALPIYLSKPLTRADYVLGKFAVLCLLQAVVTWVPAMLLLGVQVLFAGDIAFLHDNLFLVPAIAVQSAVQVCLFAVGMLALSSLSNSRRFAGVMFAGAFFLSGAMSQVLRRVTDSPSWASLSPRETLGALADTLFRLPVTPDIPVPVAALVVTAVIGVSILVIARHVRGVEVV